MKKLLFLLMALLLAIALVACGEDNSNSGNGNETPDAGDTCTHKDGDDDGKCDLCGEPHDDGPDKPACTHKDGDDDGKCDLCGEPHDDGPDKPACTHKDGDDDGKCDLCGEPHDDGPTELKKITGVTFSNITYTYDGKQKTIAVSGTLPTGVSVDYTSEKGTDAGTYNAIATLSGEGYETLVLKATLTISKADITGIDFSNKTVVYNGKNQKLLISGTAPDGTNVEYKNNEGTAVGTYNATVTISGKNYNTLTLTAKLIIKSASFAGITFEDLTVVYDGNEHEIKISGTLPSGATVSYTKNKGTKVGTYDATATISCEGYESLTLNATLTIKKAPIVAEITLADKIVEYDTQLHSLELVGNIPSGAYVKYTYNGKEVSGVSEVGTYTVVATVYGDNIETTEYTATLLIISVEELLHSVNHNGVVYFQNNLDDNKLYKYVGGKVVKVNNDKPEFFYSDGTNLYYYSTSLFSKSIKKITSVGVSAVYSVSGEYLAIDGTYVYWAVNNTLFKTEENGIYRYDLSGNEAEPTKIASVKAAYINVVGDKVYFSNLSDGKKLYSVPASGGEPVLVHDEKVSYIISDGGVLYFDSWTLTGSAIYKYDTESSELKKLTVDSGKYLTKAGNYIYYINNDLLTSTVFGDGIYKVSINGTAALPSMKVLSCGAGDGYSSLTTDGTYLYYYKLSTKHFYRCDLSGNNEVDLMAGFTPPVEEVSLKGDAVIAEYNGEIYYTNNRDGLTNGACLYKYNPTTGTRVKVLADDVAGVWFNGDYMYYSTCILTNYALFRMDMTTNVIEKINSDRCENLIFDGDYIYYINVSAVANNAIMKMNATNLTAEPEELFKEKNVSVTGMYKVGDTFYFISNPKIGSQTIHTYTIGGNEKGASLDIKAKHLVVLNDRIYYYDGYSDALKSCGLDGSDIKTIKSGVTINDLYAYGGKVYFASTSSESKGLYVYDAASDTTDQITTMVADGVVWANGSIWFVDTAVDYAIDYPTHSGGDGYLYCYNGTSVNKK